MERICQAIAVSGTLLRRCSQPAPEGDLGLPPKGLAASPACVSGPNLPRQLGTGDRDLALKMESGSNLRFIACIQTISLPPNGCGWPAIHGRCALPCAVVYLMCWLE
jgi:hypothetical protein